MLETIVIAVITSGAVLPAVFLWWWFWDRVHVRVQSGVNDDAAAAEMFIRVISSAKESLVIHDDGDRVDGAMYEDERVIDALRRQLSKHDALQIRCLFNDREELTLVQRVGAEYPGRFQALYRRGPRPIGDIHYKIADGGVMGHLSVHGHRQPERSFKLLDCSAAKPRTRKSAFGKYLRDFERDAAIAVA